jgi:hypothetical protein
MAAAPPGIAGELEHLARMPGRQAWIGEHPPYDFVGLPLRGATNLRAAAVHHGRYDVVWCYEDALAGLRPGQHELLIDELVRLIGERGRLVVRIDRSLPDFSIVGLKHLLGRRHDTRVVVEQETADDAFTVVFGVERSGMERQRSDAWTCAVQTRGTRVGQVVEFCRSVREQDPDHRHEILVWGPADPAYEPYGVTCHDPGYRDHLAEISRKKNDIAARARHANLLIVHDRYRLDPGFFVGFARFGHDFDLVTVPQRYVCGTHFPAYVAAEGTILGRGRSIDCRDYDTLRPGQYINGGLLVAKTETLRSIRLNDLLFWNQWEDVELAWEFRNRGLPPRVNCFSSATTLGIGPEHTRHFIPESTALRGIGDGATSVARTVLASGRKIEQQLRPFFRRLAGRAR